MQEPSVTSSFLASKIFQFRKYYWELYLYLVDFSFHSLFKYFSDAIYAFIRSKKISYTQTFNFLWWKAKKKEIILKLGRYFKAWNYWNSLCKLFNPESRIFIWTTQCIIWLQEEIYHMRLCTLLHYISFFLSFQIIYLQSTIPFNKSYFLALTFIFSRYK